VLWGGVHILFSGNSVEIGSNFSLCVCFSVPTTTIIFLRCGPQREKMSGVVVYNVKKWLALLATTKKNVHM
jgi:hypothetical protein